MPELWAGTDAGKAAHHCTVIDTDGSKALSRRVPNNEPELLEMIGDVLALAEGSPVTWAVDLNASGGALLIALLISHDQRLLYRTPTSSPTRPGCGGICSLCRSGIAVDLKILTARRYDLAADRTRAINRMRAQLLEYFPVLERTFDYAASKGALVLLTGYPTPAGLRRIGAARLATWLKNRKVRGAQVMADAAVAAAQAQHTAVPGESTAATVVNTLARAVLALDEEIADIDARITARFREHHHAEVVLSMPGMGPLLGAEFIACTGGDMDAFGTAGRLAGVAGLAPVPRDSGRISGNMRRPHRYHRRLLRVFYFSAQIAARFCTISKTFYDRKRAEGKSHKQAVLALARRRLDVLWALLRDQRHWTAHPPQPEAVAA